MTTHKGTESAIEDAGETFAFIGRDAILSLDDRKYATVHVPEWGGHVMLRGITAGERDRWESQAVTITGQGKNQVRNVKGNLRASLLVLSIVDPTTKQPMFTRADVDALAAKSAAAMDRLYDKARDLSGMSEDDIKELEKNS